MKNRNLNHRDDWATPPYFFNRLDSIYSFDFDPCPFGHEVESWDGLKVEWGNMNFVNPPYSPSLKESFVKKAIEESEKGHMSVVLLPVSTSTILFHDYIYPNASSIEYVKGRIKFIGENTKGQLVNWGLLEPYGLLDEEEVRGMISKAEGREVVSNSGMHDSMLVTFKPKSHGRIY